MSLTLSSYTIYFEDTETAVIYVILKMQSYIDAKHSMWIWLRKYF